MKKADTAKCMALAVLLAAIFLTGGCGARPDSVISFSFTRAEPSDFSGSETVTIIDDEDQLTLDVTMTMDGGTVTMEVKDLSDGGIVWSGEYDEDSQFELKLTGLEKYGEYSLGFRAKQSKNVSLIIKSEDRLIKSPERPEK